VDKSYSHVDCVSFVTMQANGTVEALTADSDFGAEGFTVLMQEPIA
jgi:predicted nucleic acid-binding protein